MAEVALLAKIFLWIFFNKKVYWEKKNLSQQWLADKTWLHRTYISDIERGVKNVALENIEKISIAFEIEVRELF